jgi:hypothetical protein
LGNDRRQRLGVTHELGAAGFHVRAADVELIAVDRSRPVDGSDAERFLDPHDDGRKVVDRRPNDVHQLPGVREMAAEPCEMIASNRLEPRVGQADRVDHPRAEVGDAQRGVSLSWLGAHGLGDDTAKAIQIDDVV